MQDSHQQLIGPIVVVNIEGLSRCQHSIFEELVQAQFDVVSLGDLHTASLRRRDFARFQHSVAEAIRRRGLRPLSEIALGARIHLTGLQVLAHCQQLSKFGESVQSQLSSVLGADRRGEIDGVSQFAQARLSITARTRAFSL